MTPALIAALAAARAAYADFGAKLEAIVMLLAVQPAQEEPPPVVVDPPPVVVDPPPVVDPPAAAGFKLAVQANGSLLITGVDKVTWTLVKNSEAESWPWYGERHTDVPVPADGLVIPIQPVENDTDFVKVLYVLPDGSMGAEDGPKTWKAPASPVVTQPPVTSGGRTAVNLLLRGQSNAYLFKDWGGLDQLVEKLEAALPIKVKILADFDNSDGAASIHSGTAFLNWDSDGEQKSLLAFIGQQSAAVRKQPTVTIWMHNEYEQQGAGTEAQWLTEFNADRKLVAAAFGQAASSLPIVFTPVPYNYGQNRNWLTAMRKLAAEPAQNCTLVEAFAGALMDGDGQPNSSHMGRGDQALVANALVAPLKSIFGNMLTPANAAPPVVDPPVVTVPATPAGSGRAMAEAFRRKSVFNLNWERERFVRFSYDAAVKANYNDVGIGGVRGFIPWKPGGKEGRQFWDLDLEKAPTKEQFNRFLPNAKALVADKKILMLDFLDEVGLESFTPTRLPGVKAYLKNACTWVKEWGLDPAYTCFGPVNEWAGGEDNNGQNPERRNATYEALRFEFDAILQAELGDRYLIGMAPAYWGHHDSYTGNKNGKYNIGSNKQRIHFWHAYDRNDVKGWTWVQSQIDAWEKANGAVVMNGEIGPGNWLDGNNWDGNGGGSWVEHIDNQNPALANSVPNLWACTDGAWTMNRGHADARLWVKDKGWEPLIEDAVRRAVIANRKARGL